MTLSASDDLIAASGGTGAVAVTTDPECAWTAVAEAGWITDVAPVRGQGSGQVQFRATATPSGSPRESGINVNNQRAIIRQAGAPCQIQVAISDSHFTSFGGTGTIVVTAPSGCVWASSSDDGWIALTPPASGTGAGSLSFTVAPNSGTGRLSTLTVGGVSIAISQDAPGGAPNPTPSPACAVSLQPSFVSMPAIGGSSSAAITASAGCAWTAASQVPWITITSAAGGSSNGSIAFAVAANISTAGRIGSIHVGGTTLTVSQAGSLGTTCTVSINPTSQSVAAAGAAGVNVAVSTATGCTWTATSNAPWVTVAAGASGSGNGTVTLNVAANAGISRMGTATIGGQTFTVNQTAGCTYSINPTSQSIGAAGGAGTSVAVSATSGCSWTAASNAAWLTVTSGAGGTGDGNVAFTVAANAGGARAGTLTIAGRSFTVNQASGSCSATLSPQSQSVNALGGAFAVSVTIPVGCNWTATSNVGWVTITGGASGSGNGTVNYSVALTLLGSRSGTLTIAGQAFTVDQAGLLGSE